MTDYIVHKRYTGRVLDGSEKDVILERGTKAFLVEENGFIFLENTVPVCAKDSLVAHEHFCRNDDGKGLLRGKLTWAIAFAQRSRISKDGKPNRFSDEELNEINTNWKHFIRPDTPNVILFNTEFFNADTDILKQFAKAINISVNLDEFGEENLTNNVDDDNIQKVESTNSRNRKEIISKAKEHRVKATPIIKNEQINAQDIKTANKIIIG